MSIERAIASRKEQLSAMARVLKERKKDRQNTKDLERRIELVEAEIKKLGGEV